MNPQTEKALLTVLELMQRQLQDPPSDPARIILSLVPAFGIVFGSVVLFFLFYWQYSMRKEMVRAGVYRHSTLRNLRVFCLLLGCLAAGVGLPMTILFYLLQGMTYALLGGLIPLGCGIGLLCFYALASREN